MAPDAAQVKELSTVVFESSGRLLEVLNSLLDFSKLEAGKVDVDKFVFSIPDVVTSVVRLVQPSVESKGLKIEVTVDSEFPNAVFGDGNKIRRILLNYVHNAIKFTKVGSVRIAVTVDSFAGADLVARFSVSDTGIGIAPTAVAKLFQPFVQADGSTTRKFGGTGLGLSIAKQLTELMGGETGLTSEENKGSTFWFSVPLVNAS